MKLHAVALYVEEKAVCDFPTKSFAGLANMHILATFQQLTGKPLARPRALLRHEAFSVSERSDFATGRR